MTTPGAVNPSEGKLCNHGVRYVEGDTFGSRRYDYSDACNRPATGQTTYGAPRCEEHEAKRWVVTVGTSIAITESIHDSPDQARTEVRHRLGTLGLRVNLNLMTARPATAADIERFEAIASQTVESVTVSGPST